MEPYLSNKALGNPLAMLRHLKVEVMLNILVMKGKLESDTPISITELRVGIGYLDDAWGRFLDQYDLLSQISGRGRFYGLEACYSELHKQYRGYATGWQRILDEEQAKPEPDYVDKLALGAATREQLDKGPCDDDDCSCCCSDDESSDNDECTDTDKVEDLNDDPDNNEDRSCSLEEDKEAVVMKAEEVKKERP